MILYDFGVKKATSFQVVDLDVGLYGLVSDMFPGNIQEIGMREALKFKQKEDTSKGLKSCFLFSEKEPNLSIRYFSQLSKIQEHLNFYYIRGPISDMTR